MVARAMGHCPELLSSPLSIGLSLMGLTDGSPRAVAEVGPWGGCSSSLLYSFLLRCRVLVFLLGFFFPAPFARGWRCCLIVFGNKLLVPALVHP